MAIFNRLDDELDQPLVLNHKGVDYVIPTPTKNTTMLAVIMQRHAEMQAEGEEITAEHEADLQRRVSPDLTIEEQFLSPEVFAALEANRVSARVTDRMVRAVYFWIISGFREEAAAMVWNDRDEDKVDSDPKEN